MQTNELRDIDRLLDQWQQLLEEFPQMKRQLLQELSLDLLTQVQQEIGGSGKVQSWQERYLGSGGGYLAVRPAADTYQVTESGTRYAVGYVSNAVEKGHRHRSPEPSGKDGYRYRPRIKVPATPGRHFYAAVRSRMERVGAEEVRRLAAEVAARLEGRSA